MEFDEDGSYDADEFDAWLLQSWRERFWTDRHDFGEYRFGFIVDDKGRLHRDNVRGDLLVTVHLAPVEGRLACIGADLRAFSGNRGDEAKSLRGRKPPRQVNATIWRQIPLGELIEEAFAQERRSVEYFDRPPVRPRSPEDEEARRKRLAERKAELERTKPKRGPKSSLTPQVLDVVSKAYAVGGRRPVQAVRQALEDAGYPGAGPHKDVTIDQARKAVMKAREVGLIAPANKKGVRT